MPELATQPDRASQVGLVAAGSDNKYRFLVRSDDFPEQSLPDLRVVDVSLLGVATVFAGGDNLLIGDNRLLIGFAVNNCHTAERTRGVQFQLLEYALAEAAEPGKHNRVPVLRIVESFHQLFSGQLGRGEFVFIERGTLPNDSGVFQNAQKSQVGDMVDNLGPQLRILVQQDARHLEIDLIALAQQEEFVRLVQREPPQAMHLDSRDHEYPYPAI